VPRPLEDGVEGDVVDVAVGAAVLLVGEVVAEVGVVVVVVVSLLVMLK
jgi:hypothetical protein